MLISDLFSPAAAKSSEGIRRGLVGWFDGLVVGLREHRSSHAGRLTERIDILTLHIASTGILRASPWSSRPPHLPSPPDATNGGPHARSVLLAQARRHRRHRRRHRQSRPIPPSPPTEIGMQPAIRVSGYPGDPLALFFLLSRCRTTTDNLNLMQTIRAGSWGGK